MSNPENNQENYPRNLNFTPEEEGEEESLVTDYSSPENAPRPPVIVKGIRDLDAALERLNRAVISSNTKQKDFFDSLVTRLREINRVFEEFLETLRDLISKYRNNNIRLKDLERERPSAPGPPTPSEEEEIDKLMKENANLRNYIINIIDSVNEVSQVIESQDYEGKSSQVDGILNTINGHITEMYTLLQNADNDDSPSFQQRPLIQQQQQQRPGIFERIGNAFGRKGGRKTRRRPKKHSKKRGGNKSTKGGKRKKTHGGWIPKNSNKSRKSRRY